MILEMPPQSYVAWRTCITLFHVMAALSTVFRIRERYQSRQMWLDDYLIILPMTVIMVYCIIPWILPSVSPDPRTAQHSDDDDSWASYLFAFTIIWFSRICFMLSVARIFPQGRLSRSRILLIAWFFAVLYCICMILAALHCDPTSSSDRHCVLFADGHRAIAFVYIVDTFSIIVMITCPLVVLWRIKLERLEKRIILAALSGSTMTFVIFGALLVLTYAPFHKESVPYLIVTCMLWNLVTAASLLSSNALVIVTTIFRAFRSRQARLEVAEQGRDALRKARPELNGTRRTTLVQESRPSFEIENSDQNINHRSLASYFFNLHSSRGRTTERQSERVGRSSSRTPSPPHTLTDISMEEFDSQNGPPDSSYYLPQPSKVFLAPNRASAAAQLNHTL